MNLPIITIVTKEQMSKVIALVTVWKLIIYKVIVGLFVVMLLQVTATEFDWMKEPLHKKIQYIACILAVGAKYIEAFLDQTIQNIKQKKHPLGIDESAP